MGFPACYSELLLPKIFLHFLSLLVLIRRLVSSLLRLAGVPDFLDDCPSSSAFDSSSSWADGVYFSPTTPEEGCHSSAAALREILPVVRLSEMPASPESCSVCLYEFEPHHEARRLPNCCHVFHRCCLDRWIGYGQRTCPLCRTSLVPDDVAETVNQGLWGASSGDSDFYDDLTHYDLHLNYPLPIADGL
ncbi:hypothetical protein SAY86_028468 [Trapa natans]|uniref:RING-type domain-containing protein n=1 Tax=Trapa natans TaxID=22666 RepID=A0AAN7RAS0_TRANT|nr:hypothetical protein SAY86_028468 [Trapa natans]